MQIHLHRHDAHGLKVQTTFTRKRRSKHARLHGRNCPTPRPTRGCWNPNISSIQHVSRDVLQDIAHQPCTRPVSTRHLCNSNFAGEPSALRPGCVLESLRPPSNLLPTTLPASSWTHCPQAPFHRHPYDDIEPCEGCFGHVHRGSGEGVLKLSRIHMSHDVLW